MKHVESWLAAGMAIMCVLTIGLVLYVGTLMDQRDEQEDAIALLRDVIALQNQVIEGLGGAPIAVPIPAETSSPPTRSPPTFATTTTAALASTTTTGTTTTTTAPPTCEGIVVAGLCIGGP